MGACNAWTIIDAKSTSDCTENRNRRKREATIVVWNDIAYIVEKWYNLMQDILIIKLFIRMMKLVYKGEIV